MKSRKRPEEEREEELKKWEEQSVYFANYFHAFTSPYPHGTTSAGRAPTSKKRERERECEREEATHEVVGKPQLVGRSMWLSFGIGLWCWEGVGCVLGKTVACGTTKHL